MSTIPYQKLVEQRKNCTKCEGHGLCDDINLCGSNSLLYQLETVLKNKPISINSLGPWNPANNSNPLTASVLIIGQDFSHVGYFDGIGTKLEIDQKECVNATNIKLIDYIELIKGIDKEQIHFANAVLCIKSGKMNAPIKQKWIINCSNNFLKPLIVHHLSNLKTIITLGKVALDSVRVISEDVNKIISDFMSKDNFSSIPGETFDINIEGKLLKLCPMFHPGRLGARNASKVNKKPGDLWKAISLV